MQSLQSLIFVKEKKMFNLTLKTNKKTGRSNSRIQWMTKKNQISLSVEYALFGKQIEKEGTFSAS